MLHRSSFEAQREGFLFLPASRLGTISQHHQLTLISHESCEFAMEDDSMDSGPSSSDYSTNNVYNARLEDILRGFAKDPKALAHKLGDFTVRTLVGMNEEEYQKLFELLRSDLSVADFFAIKVAVREAKKRFNAESTSPRSAHSTPRAGSASGAPRPNVDVASSSRVDVERPLPRLPEHVIHMVLARLPVPSFLRMRAVCKDWWHLMYATSFLEICSKQSSERSCFVFYERGKMVANGEGAIYIPSSNKWLKLSLSFLPCNLKEPVLVTGGGGLLCFVCNKLESGSVIVVCNPVTKSWRELPPLDVEDPEDFMWYLAMVSIVVDEHSNSYKVILVSQTSYEPYNASWRTLVYSSLTKDWSRPQSHYLGADVHNDTCEMWTPVECNGVLFENFGTEYVWTYDMLRGTWRHIELPIPSDSAEERGLVEIHGHLFRVLQTEDDDMKNIQIWELNPTDLSCLNVEFMPVDLAVTFLDVSFTVLGIHSIAGNDALCFLSLKGQSALLYDLSERSWNWMPKFPLFKGSNSCCLNLRLDISA